MNKTSKMEKGNLYTGTSGLVLPLPNIKSFPVQFHHKSRLEIYSAYFNSIEINSSFYKVPMAATVKKWADTVHENFRFTFKLWKNITHHRDLVFEPEDVHRFMQTIAMAGKKKGCLLIQLPPKTTAANAPRLESLLEIISTTNETGWKLSVEFRDNSWYKQETYAMLDHYNSAVVLHDIPKSALSSVKTAADVVYIRFHGLGGSYRGGYSDDFLYEYSSYIREWAAEGKTVYVYFNNTIGDAVRNLATLNGYLASDQTK